MLIRTLRQTEIAGRHARPFAIVDLPPAEAAALIDAGQAEPWPPAPSTPEAPAPAAAQPE